MTCCPRAPPHPPTPPFVSLLQVCYYRDKNSINKFQLAKVTKDGVTTSGALLFWSVWQMRMLAFLLQRMVWIPVLHAPAVARRQSSFACCSAAPGTLPLS